MLAILTKLKHKTCFKLQYYLRFLSNFHISTTDISLEKKSYSQEVKKDFKIFSAPGHYPAYIYIYIHITIKSE